MLAENNSLSENRPIKVKILDISLLLVNLCRKSGKPQSDKFVKILHKSYHKLIG